VAGEAVTLKEQIVFGIQREMEMLFLKMANTCIEQKPGCLFLVKRVIIGNQ
jgi:hypothetical protein